MASISWIQKTERVVGRASVVYADVVNRPLRLLLTLCGFDPDSTFFGLAPVTNVRAFGAVGDGVTDDTDAFTAAMAALSANTFARTLYVPDGTYMIRAENANTGGHCIRLVSRMLLDIAPGATLKAIAGSLDTYAVVCIESVTDVTVRGGTVQGERTDHTGSTGEFGMGVQVGKDCARIRILDVTAKDCWGDGIYVGNALVGHESVDIKIDGCVCDNNRRQGISIVAGKRGRITNCTLMGTNGTAPQAGIDLEQDPGEGVVEDWTVVGNVFSGNSGFGIAVDWCTAVVVTGNTFVNNTLGGISIGIAVTDAIVTGNRVRCNGATQYGIYNSFNLGSIISGNFVTGTFLYGIWCRAGGTADSGGQTIVSSNRIIGNASTAGQYGIYVTNRSDRMNVTDNQVTATVNGIYVADTQRALVTGNRVWAVSGIGIQLEGGSPGCDYSQVHDNFVQAASLDGIHIATGNYVSIQSNTVADCGHHGIYASVLVDSVVKGNVSTGNGTATNVTYHNFNLSLTTSVVTHNTARKGSAGNKPSRGIAIAGTDNLVRFNDTRNGGQDSGIQDTGTNTQREAWTFGAVVSDADASLASEDPVCTVVYTTALTANRTLTLPSSFNYPGRRIRVCLQAPGGHTLHVGAVKDLTTASWVDLEYIGAAFVVTASGTLV